MDDLAELYQQVILDHNRRPRHFGKLAAATQSADGHNPICGDHVTVHVRVDGGVIADAAFEGSGCAISRASASLMTDAVIGRPVPDAEKLFRDFQGMVTADPTVPLDNGAKQSLGKLAALGGVRAFPSRIKCATLAWHALHAALSAVGRPVSTE
jgi:nitrogen fixation NifU-like protein